MAHPTMTQRLNSLKLLLIGGLFLIGTVGGALGYFMANESGAFAWWPQYLASVASAGLGGVLILAGIRAQAKPPEGGGE